MVAHGKLLYQSVVYGHGNFLLQPQRFAKFVQRNIQGVAFFNQCFVFLSYGFCKLVLFWGIIFIFPVTGLPIQWKSNGR